MRPPGHPGRVSSPRHAAVKAPALASGLCAAGRRRSSCVGAGSLPSLALTQFSRPGPASVLGGQAVLAVGGCAASHGQYPCPGPQLLAEDPSWSVAQGSTLWASTARTQLPRAPPASALQTLLHCGRPQIDQPSRTAGRCSLPCPCRSHGSLRGRGQEGPARPREQSLREQGGSGRAAGGRGQQPCLGSLTSPLILTEATQTPS